LTELNPNLKITSSLAEASHSRQIVTSHPDLFNRASNHKTRCAPYQDHLLGTILQNLCMANCYFIKKISELTVQPPLEVRFRKPLSILQLTANCFGITTNQTRHRFDPDHPALPHQKNSIRFIKLLTNLPVDHPTHNRTL
jgi:hypothetical protein